MTLGLRDRLRGRKLRTRYNPGDLKGQLLDFVRSDRFKGELKHAVRERFGGDVMVGDEDELINFFDWFALERPTRSGKTPLELFVEKERKRGMPEEICQQLMRWGNVIEGLFEIRKLIDRDTVLTYEHLRQREYVVKSNKPGFLAKHVSPGYYMIARIVPWYDHYYFSGASAVLPPETKEQVSKLIEGMREKYPELAFAEMEEEELEMALATQEEVYRAFVEFFGDDEVVFPTGREMAKGMEAFYRYYIFERVQESSGKTLAQQAREAGMKPSLPKEEYPPELLEVGEIGVLIDLKEGFIMLPEYGTFRRIFIEEDFQSIPGYRQLIYNYLKEDSIPPLPFQRMVERHPEQAKRVFQAVLRRRKFSLKRDFPRLMRRYKRKWLERGPKPWITIKE
ncbi:MAG: hypothetical protein ACE5MB_01185 [Anaerolineae bacterium]